MDQSHTKVFRARSGTDTLPIFFVGATAVMTALNLLIFFRNQGQVIQDLLWPNLAFVFAAGFTYAISIFKVEVDSLHSKLVVWRPFVPFARTVCDVSEADKLSLRYSIRTTTTVGSTNVFSAALKIGAAIAASRKMTRADADLLFVSIVRNGQERDLFYVACGRIEGCRVWLVEISQLLNIAMIESGPDAEAGFHHIH